MLPYFIYLLLIFFLSYYGAKSKALRFFLFVVAVLFLGLREGVGTDFEEYKKRYDLEIYSFEIGYNYLCIFLHQFKCSSAYLFLSLAFITYLPFYLLLERLKCNRKHFVLLSYLLYFGTFSIICNVMRECLVAAWFLYAYYLIKDRKLLPYLVMIAVGMTFHTSIILCLPLYWVVNKQLPIFVYCIIYLVSFAFCFISIDKISAYILPIIGEFNQWARYMNSDHSLSGYISIGVFVDIVFYLFFFILCIKNNIYKEYPIAFNLFFLSCILFNMKVGSIIMGRIWLLYKWYLYIVIIYILHNKKKRFLAGMTVRLYILYSLLAFVQYTLSEESSMYPYKCTLSFNYF